PGGAVAAGQPVLRLAATDEREVAIDLTEQDVAAHPVGTRFIVRLVANAEVAAEATLNRIDPVAFAATRTRTAHLTLRNAARDFRLGALVLGTRAAEAGAGGALPGRAGLGPDGPGPGRRVAGAPRRAQ